MNWIDIELRTPNHYQIVLCFDSDEDKIFQARYLDLGETKAFRVWGFRCKCDEGRCPDALWLYSVTFWIPLPQKPLKMLTPSNSCIADVR